MGLLLDLIKIGWEMACMKWNLKKYPVPDLHSKVMRGRLSEAGLYRLLRPNQVDEFIAYHEKVTVLLDLVDENGAQEETESFVKQNPELGLFWVNNGLYLIADKRRRTWAGLNQISNMIKRDLEKSVLHARGKDNIVRREN